MMVGRGEIVDKILVTLTLFSRWHEQFEMSNLDKNSILEQYISYIFIIIYM